MQRPCGDEERGRSVPKARDRKRVKKKRRNCGESGRLLQLSKAHDECGLYLKNNITN